MRCWRAEQQTVVPARVILWREPYTHNDWRHDVTTFRAFIIALFATSSAYAQGVVMVMNQTPGGGQPTQVRMQLDSTHARTEIRDQGQQMTVTYDAAAKVMRMIDNAKKTYTEITEQDIKQMAGMMAQMQAQMKNMPPEVQKQMAGRGGMPGMPGAGAPQARTTYKRTGSSKVGQWACTTYDGFRGAEKVAEVCAAESGVNVTAADFQVIQQLADMMKSMAPPGALDQIATFGTVESQGFAGLPVRTVSFQNGKPVSTTELVELRREAIPASVFAVPAGFKKQDMGMGR